MNAQLKQLDEKLKMHLDEPRYIHSVGVMYTAAALAMRYGFDMERARVAGLLHDCAKCIPPAEKIRLCEEYGLGVSEVEYKNPGLLHSKLGAYFLETKYGIIDEEMKNAITYHSTGRPQMTLFDKIIYIADYMEPNREKAPNLAHIRKLAFEDIDECLFVVLEATLEYLKDNKAAVDPMTEQTYLYYKEKREQNLRGE